MAGFYLDENLDGRIFSGTLEASGIMFSTCQSLGYRGIEDHIWIPEVAERGLIIVTGDKRIRRNRVEKAAVLQARARIVQLSFKAPMEQLAQNFVNSQRAIERIALDETGPWIATLSFPDEQAFKAGKAGKLAKRELS